MGTQDYGITISQPGQNATTAAGNQILMTTSSPFLKIDTTNAQGFQTITLIITTDPTEPAAGTSNYTVLYKFKHNYAYVPTLETLFVVTSAAPGQTSTSYQAYFYDYGILATSTHGIGGGALLYAAADKTWVYYIVEKYNDGSSPTLLTGTNVNITSHVFVDDIGV